MKENSCQRLVINVGLVFTTDGWIPVKSLWKLTAFATLAKKNARARAISIFAPALALPRSLSFFFLCVCLTAGAGTRCMSLLRDSPTLLTIEIRETTGAKPRHMMMD